MFKNNIELQKNLGFIFFTLALLLALLVRTYFMHGNSSDGFLYDTISRDMSVGVGGTWAPSWFAQNGLSVFYEHPSFSIFLNSLFYRVLGDSIFVGKLYIFTTFALSMFFVCLIWRRFFKFLSWHYLWIPVLFWLSIPEHLWCYKNTMIQNTEAVFSLCSSWLIFVSLDMQFDYKQNKRLFYKACGITSLAAIALFFAFITNGPESLFPLGIYMAHWLVIRSGSFSQAFSRSFLLLSVFLLFGAIFFYLIPAAYHNFYMYFETQLVATLNGSRGGDAFGWDRFYIIKIIFEKLIALLLLSLSLFYFYQKGEPQNILSNFIGFIKKDKRILLFMLIGLMGSVPIMLSKRQVSYYTMQAYAYFLLGFLFILTPIIESLLSTNWVIKFNNLRFKLFTFILSVVAMFFVVYSMGSAYRDKAMVSDVIKLVKVIPNNYKLSHGVLNGSSFHVHLRRYGGIELVNGSKNSAYYIVMKGDKPAISGYKKLNLNTQRYDLYKGLG